MPKTLDVIFYRVIGFVLALLLVGCTGDVQAQQGRHAGASRSHNPILVQGLPDFSILVRKVGPSVVNIQTFVESGRGGELKSDGVGSGFIISADGYIMTNEHVVRGSDDIIVTLQDMREYRAVLVGSDRRSDVAIVKIEASEDLPAVLIGNPDDLNVGEWVVAIGSPYGLENTVTAGIISATQRDTGAFMSFIQSDVAINPGNSGGPLINMRGEVVGVNSRIYRRSGSGSSGGYSGISFSIPIDEAMAVAAPLREKGFVERGRIGVDGTSISSEIARAIGFGERAYGAMVSAVIYNSTAERAGIEIGDIITKVNGRRVNRGTDLARLIGHLSPGSEAQLEVFRRGTTLVINVTVESMPISSSASSRSRSAAAQADSPTDSSEIRRLRINVVNLTTEQKNTHHLRHGVSVRSVSALAARSGIRRGDIILRVGETRIRNASQFNRLLRTLEFDRDIPFLILRNQQAQYVLLRAQR